MNTRNNSLVKCKYLLHVHFDKKNTTILDLARNYALKKYKKYLLNKPFTYGYPHLSIIYGPIKIVSKENNTHPIKIFNKNIIDELWPKFIDTFNNTLPDDVIYKGVTPFFTLDRIIIKAEFESKKLNKIFKFLLNCNSEIKQYYDEFKKEDDERHPKLKIMFPKLYKKEKRIIKIPKNGYIRPLRFYILI
jgi:hypothetical protein